MMFCAYLIHQGTIQSSTIKSYVSAIKAILKLDGYNWDDQKIYLTSLTRTCKLHNDIITCRLPIQHSLLELILFELDHIYHNQPYLATMYKSMFSVSYYGLLRIGETTESQHVLKACNVHMGQNKNKILLVLYSSKTHSKVNYPQQIKIHAIGDSSGENPFSFFCPFQLTRQYLNLRGGFHSETENFVTIQLFIQIRPGSCLNSALREIELIQNIIISTVLDQAGPVNCYDKECQLKTLKGWVIGNPMPYINI